MVQRLFIFSFIECLNITLLFILFLKVHPPTYLNFKVIRKILFRAATVGKVAKALVLG